MTSYLLDSESNELMNDLMVETASINHVEVIENVIDTLDENDSAMVNHSDDGG